MRLTLSLCAMVAGLMNAAQARTTDTLTIGVMGDQSGVVSDVGGKVLGKRIELIVADHQNKPDIASSIARRWFDSEGVEAIVDLPHTGVVLGLQQIARDKQKSLLVSGAASVEITGRSCSPFATHWTDDTCALANATARAVTYVKGWGFRCAHR
jgi:branched-chain amino acid transport system substrate-binding protein